MKRQKTSILIPCHNEGKSIRACVTSCLEQTVRPHQVIVVNDGSTDESAAILAEFGDAIEVVTIPTATGNKSRAQERGLAHVTGDIVIATDGDTVLAPDFVEHILRAYEENPTADAVCGYVKSFRYNWITACRELEYLFNQEIFKRAQARLDAVYVIPGCAGAFRTELFRSILTFDHDTLTEDLDLTYKLHMEEKRIVFAPKAVVFTQDPPTLAAYVNQIRRWYSGAWQNLRKHYQIVGRSQNSLLLSLMYVESMVMSAFLLVVPFLNIKAFAVGLVLYAAYTLVLGAVGAMVRKRWDLLYYAPAMVFLLYVNAAVFLEQFWKEAVLGKTNMVWFHPERRVMATV